MAKTAIQRFDGDLRGILPHLANVDQSGLEKLCSGRLHGIRLLYLAVYFE
jgi:hypothetical protein